jgi:hypothetical protein
MFLALSITYINKTSILPYLPHVNVPEYRMVYELFLDWNTMPPYAPNNVIVLNFPLLIIIDKGLFAVVES